MGSSESTPAPKAKPDAAETVQNTRRMMERTEKKIKFTEKEVAKLTSDARAKATAGDREGAKRILKLRKMKLDNVDKLAKRYFDLCVMADRVTDASQMKDYVDAMHEAAQATQAAMGDVDEIEDKLDDIAGINEEFDDIERAVGDRDLFNVDGVSDEDLEAEFNDLLGDDVGATTAPAAPAPHRAPAAPAPHRAPAAPAPHRAPAREPELPVPAVLAREESDPFAGLDDLEVPSDVPGAAVVEPAAAASAGAQ